MVNESIIVRRWCLRWGWGAQLKYRRNLFEVSNGENQQVTRLGRVTKVSVITWTIELRGVLVKSTWRDWLDSSTIRKVRCRGRCTSLEIEADPPRRRFKRANDSRRVTFQCTWPITSSARDIALNWTRRGCSGLAWKFWNAMSLWSDVIFQGQYFNGGNRSQHVRRLDWQSQ